MEDVVDRAVDLDRLDHVVVAELEPVVPEVLDVRERRRLEVVDADHAVAAAQERFTEVRSEEPGTAGDDSGGHGRRS